MQAIMNTHIIFLTIITTNCYAVIHRKSYQDQTSWSFQHPTTTYKKAKFGSNRPKYLATYPIRSDYERDVSIVCIMFLCFFGQYDNICSFFLILNILLELQFFRSAILGVQYFATILNAVMLQPVNLTKNCVRLDIMERLIMKLQLMTPIVEENYFL